MLKKVSVLFLVVMLCLSLVTVGCGKSEAPAEPAGQSAGDGSLDRVKKAGKIVAGLDDAFPPMGFRDEKGELTGFDIEFGKELSKKMGIEITWQPTVWDTVVASLKGKKFDVIISGMNITKERQAEVNFAGPYAKIGQILVVQAKNDAITSLKDVAKGRVGTQAGSTAHKILNNEGFTDDQIKLYKEYPLCFNDLEIGRIDAVVCDGFAIKTYTDKRPGAFKQVGEQMGVEDAAVGVAVRKEDKELLEALNKAIDELLKDGTLSKISEKWIGFDITKDL